jgi:hypothetical protein
MIRLIPFVLLLVSCGSNMPMPTVGRFLPLKVGASWTYKITDSGNIFSNKKTTVEAKEDIGGMKAGVMAFRVRTEDTTGVSVGWQEDTGEMIVRHKEQSFDLKNKQLDETFYTASKLRIDESMAHLTKGATYSNTYTEKSTDSVTMMTTTTSKTENWTVEEVDEMVTVGAGTFKALKLHRVGTAVGASDKRFWFVRGVGKVKETGGSRIEELQSFTIP